MSTDISIKEYARQDNIVKSFADILGERQANAYITSVLIAVANSQALQECTPVSIISSAMRAATLSLSVDPGVGQAYLVPFKGRATLIIGYKGYKDLALRTGKYRHLNVSKIYEGEEIIEDRLTGMHSFNFNAHRTGKAVIGYLLYFELVTGYRKTVYMTVDEIHEHAEKYSKNYGNANSIWKTDFEAMAKKTVLRLGLTHWGYFEPNIATLIAQDEVPPEEELQFPDDEPVDTTFTDLGPEVQPTPKPRMSEQQALSELGFG